MPAAPSSAWNDSVPITGHPQSTGEIEADLAVVGGGTAGITALLAKLCGLRVAVLEGRRIGRRVIGHPNVKITSLHSLIDADLMARLGEDAGRTCGEAHQAAIRRSAGWVEEREIECGFERRPACTFTQTPERVARSEAGDEAAVELGLPASLHTDIGLRCPVQAALGFDDQGRFDLTACVPDLAERDGGGPNGVVRHSRLPGYYDFGRRRKGPRRAASDADETGTRLQGRAPA